MLERARALGVYDRLERAEAVAWLEANDEHFDLIVSADVLIYIGDLDRLFAGVRRALASGGLFAFSIELAPSGGLLDFGVEHGGRRPADEPPYALQPSLRYTHSAAYVRELAARHGLARRPRRAGDAPRRPAASGRRASAST